MSSTTNAPTGPQAQLIVSGNAATGMVALTFDQGISGAGDSPSVMSTLRANGVRSTFFLTGVWVEQNPQLTKQLVADGHELGNHSYDHPDFTTVSDAEIAAQMNRTETLVQQTTGRSTKPYMRPPFGAYSSHVLSVLGGLGYGSVIYWTLDSTDWREESTSQSVVEWVLAKAKAGDIVVFHGYTPKTAAALPSIISGLKAKNLKLGTVSEVLGR